MRLRWARGDYTPALRSKMRQAIASCQKEQWMPERRLGHSLAMKAAHDRGAYDDAYGEVHRKKVSIAARAAHARDCYKERHEQQRELLCGTGNPNWQGGKITRVCEFCGVEFAVFPRTLKRGQGHFCSRDCATKALSGSNAPTWKGGISFEPYPPEFNKAFKKQIRKRDKYRCAICRFPGNHVHHIDYCKKNTEPNNCITLCASCHATTNSDREYWQIVLQDILNKRCRYRSVGNQAGPGLYEAADPWGLATNTGALDAIRTEAS